jgi:hypothetical protein
MEKSCLSLPTPPLRNLNETDLLQKPKLSLVCKEDLIAADNSTFVGPHPLFAAERMRL